MANSKNNTAGDALVELFSNVATKLGLDPNILVEKAQELTGEEQAAYMKALQDFDMNSTEESAQAVLSFFQQTPAYQKLGGKIRDFVCKHAKGGRLDCGCKENGGVVKGQDGIKFYNENGVELPNGPIYREDRYGYMVAPTKAGETAMFLNNLNSKAAYWNIPAYPVEQSVSKFRIAVDEDYPEGQLAFTNFEPREKASAIANISKYQQQDKPWNGVEKKQTGGEVDYEYTHPDLISRRQALDLSMQTRGYNRDQARFAYANAKNALRNQGLSGRELRREARKMLVGYNDGSRELVAPTQVYNTSNALADATKNVYSQDLLNKALLWTVGPGISTQNAAAKVQQNMDANSFNTAFGYARKLGLKNFRWRGNLYGTKLASGPQLPKIDTTVDTSYEVPGIEFEPIPIGSTQTEQATPRSIVVSSSQPMPTLGNNIPVPEIVTSGIVTPSGSIAQPTPAFMRGSSPYMELAPGESVPTGWYVGSRPAVTTKSVQRTTQVQQNGGKVEKGQEGSILDYYSNKWSNDLARIKSGWNKFKASAPGKVLGAFMPNPNSETGMLGAAAPIGKIKVIPEGKIGSLRRANYDPFVWDVIAKDEVVLENAKNLGLKEGSKEWAEFIEKTARDINNLVKTW